MNKSSPPPLPPETQAILDCLQRVATKTLDRKRRLGHYAVLWDGQRPVAVGEDAPRDSTIQIRPGEPV
jgi:hypothetical protein